MMLDMLRGFTDRLLGRGSAALTVPPLDGALKPNNRLEDLPAGLAAQEPRALVFWQGKVHWAECDHLMTEGGSVRRLPAKITAMAARGTRLAIAVEGQGIEIDGQIPAALQGLQAITALALEGDRLWIAQGSTRRGFDGWLHDFMEQGCSGRLLSFDIARQSLEVVKDKMAYPNGLLLRPDGVLVAEAWAKRLVLFSKTGGGKVLVDDLAGYPAAMTPSAKGFWLALFAPRSPLLELVLREPTYRKAMMAEVDPEYWISPALRSGYSFAEPMQGGALKQMGVLKPWAPSRSYGLVVEMDPKAVPLQSLHSRAGGKRHGVTSVLLQDDNLWIAATGGNEILCANLGGADAAGH